MACIQGRGWIGGSEIGIGTQRVAELEDQTVRVSTRLPAAGDLWNRRVKMDHESIGHGYLA